MSLCIFFTSRIFLQVYGDGLLSRKSAQIMSSIGNYKMLLKRCEDATKKRKARRKILSVSMEEHNPIQINENEIDAKINALYFCRF